MTETCQLPSCTRSMFAKASLILTLIVGLLFVTQAQPMARPAEMRPGGACAGMQCARGCCANAMCCTLVERQQAPQTPAPAPQHTDVQLATIGLRTYTLLFTPPPLRRPFVILDKTSAAHSLSPRATSCIRLI
jgi:hypothetical protein